MPPPPPNPSAEIPLLQTKLYLPRWREGLVSRPRLVARLRRGAEGRLTLVSALPGFGKTTLLGLSLGSPEEAYPGSVREYGVGVAYQRFLWKDLYSAAHALPLLQEYRDTEGEHIENGFQLFLTLRAGSRVRLFGDRFFLEPSAAFTHWPLNTNVPQSFARLESRWPNYILFEPGLHFGIRL